MPAVAFDRFYRYDELTSILQAWAEERPDLYRLESIGRSFEDRDIWLATITNFETGADLDKPAFLIEANIHALEVTGCTAALHLIDKLLSGYGSDPKVTRCLDSRTFYVIPRLNPDGAELALADRPRFVRSSVRPYPRLDEQDGLYEEDLDGDGRILMMRMQRPERRLEATPGRTAAADPARARRGSRGRRVLPGALGGDDPQLRRRHDQVRTAARGPRPQPQLPDGVGARGRAARRRPVRRLGAGDACDRSRRSSTGRTSPATSPTTRSRGVHLRPYAGYDDEHFPTFDLRAYKLLGEEATKRTGYPAVSVFHDFKYDPKQTIKGGGARLALRPRRRLLVDDRVLEPAAARPGSRTTASSSGSRTTRRRTTSSSCAGTTSALDGKGYVDWYPFEHPQLGEVELGGWDIMYCWGNVPPQFLEREIAPHSDFALFHLLVSPRLEVEVARRRAGGRRRVQGAARPPEHRLAADERDPEGSRAEGGASAGGGADAARGREASSPASARRRRASSQGRVHKRSTLWWGSDDSTGDLAKLEWVIEAPEGGELGIEARHQRAGTVRQVVPLG